MAKVVAGGKVTIPQRIRGLLDIEDGDYVRLSLVEVIRKEAKTERRQRKI